MNKKILAILMALMMVLTSVAAFAEEAKPFTKNYVVDGDTAVAPAATFTFEAINGEPVENSTQLPADEVVYPEKITGTATLTGGDEDGEATITFEDITVDDFPNVGIYTYTLGEIDPKMGGVTIDTNTMTLYVFRTNDSIDWAVKDEEGKAEQGQNLAFNNTYEAGSLEITKNVTGAYGDQNRDFDVTVTLTGEEDMSYEGVDVTVVKTDADDKTTSLGTMTIAGEATFQIKHGETITLENLPKGVSWSIEETYVGEGYDQPEYSAQSGDIENTEADTTTITNNKDGDNIDTGVTTDSMPYFMLMAFVMILAAAVVLKKRTVNE